MDLESLDSLTNAELRSKCLEHGLPNVPVTDSSRKLLLKRLRESIINNATKESATKTSSSRRETVHATKITAVETILESGNIPNAGKSRRTIAATATAPTTIKDDAPTSIPISTRRRSLSQKESEPKATKAAAAAAALKQMPTILIEDDEEDVDLMSAVESAEKESTTSSVPIETIPSRRKSRSVSVPKITEVITIPKKRAMTPLVEDLSVIANKEFQKKIVSSQQTIVEKQLGYSGTTKVSTHSNLNSISEPSFTQPLPKTSSQDYTTRYSSSTPSVYSTPSMRYSVGAGAGLGSASLSAYRTKYTTSDLLNEQSDTDGGGNNDEPKSPFLSNFARNLERSRSVGRTSSGSTSGRYTRHSGSNYESIRGRHASQNDITFGQLMHGLNRKYHLKTIIVVLGVLCVSIFAYVAMNRNVSL